MRGFSCVALGVLWVFAAAPAHAQSSVFVAASDPTQITEVEVAKVIASDSSSWLSVKLKGASKLVVVTSTASLDPGTASEAWLRALDFATRVRVVPPLGPLAACADSSGKLADSGFPELAALTPTGSSTLTSEVELRRAFEDAGLTVDVTPLAQFATDAAPPFRFTSYEATASGGSTLAIRLTESGQPFELPRIACAGRSSLPFTLLALASTAVLPAASNVFDPSDFSVSYFGATNTTDYTSHRNAWLAEDPTRWLVEAQAAPALFSWTVLPGAGEIEPAIAHYFDAAPAQPDAHACVAAVQAAHAQGSRASADYGCDGADDLGKSLSELDFADVRLTRLFGSIEAAGGTLHAADAVSRDSRVVATDFDATGCPASVSVMPGADGSTVPSGTTTAPGGVAETPGSESSTDTGSSTDDSSSATDGESCTVEVFGDSCNGDSSSSSSSDSSSDSCSGDSSSDSSSSDSCSGDSSTDSNSSDSCSGDSSSSNGDDSSGCGKSNYDGDTCSGNSANSASADGKTSAALHIGPQPLTSRRPRPVHLSLLTLLSAALALPLRRRSVARFLSNS